jgi:hypothetical protein
MAIALGGVHAQQLGALAIAAVIIGAIAWTLVKAQRQPTHSARLHGEPIDQMARP